MFLFSSGFAPISDRFGHSSPQEAATCRVFEAQPKLGALNITSNKLDPKS